MTKYEPLGQFLRAQKRERIAMTFAEIERILGSKLPASKRYRAWWSNNPLNNVMTREWLDAGYETEQVDIAGERLVFHRKARSSAAATRPSIFGCMQGMFTVAEGYDITAPMELAENWTLKYEPKP
jgi:hypothetical protein